MVLPPSKHQHCTDEAQKAETVLSAVSYIYTPVFKNVKYIDLFLSHQKETLFDKKTKDVHIFYMYFQCCNVFENGCIYIFRGYQTRGLTFASSHARRILSLLSPTDDI